MTDTFKGPIDREWGLESKIFRVLLGLAVVLSGPNICLASDIVLFELPGGVPMEMVWVEGGRFDMGFVHPNGAHDIDEEPIHAVQLLAGFFMGVYEVTQGQWQSVMGTTPWDTSPNMAGPRRPVVNVSWLDAQDFVGRLNEYAGEELYRLPTEAEWEYVSRAKTTTTWSFGDSSAAVIEHAWCHNNASAIGEYYPHTVGMRLPNPWRLYDMAGNVWEWCSDWYGIYPDDEQADPTGPLEGFTKVIRGGAFASYCWETRPTNRGSLMPDEKSHFVGFRLVRMQR